MVVFSCQFSYLIYLDTVSYNPPLIFRTTANRAVEVNEMWRLREKQLELDTKLRGTRSESSSGRGHKDTHESHTSTSRARSEEENSASASLSSKKRSVDHFNSMEDEGLKDDEIDQFLQSRFACSSLLLENNVVFFSSFPCARNI